MSGTAELDLYNPATGEVYATEPTSTPAEIDAAIGASAAQAEAWAATPWFARAEALNAIADRIDAERDELAAALVTEQGKPLPAARGEVGAGAAFCRSTATLTLDEPDLDHHAERKIELHHRPLGVVGSITPWNFPFLIPIWHAAPALLAGNTVITKPSEYTPRSVVALARIVSDVLGPHHLTSLVGRGDAGAALVASPSVTKVVFTGSTPTGRAIAAAGAPTLTRLTLELGGNDPAIVLPDADLESLAERLFARSFGNSGQICAAVKRIYAHASQVDELAERLAAIAATKVVGPGDEAGVDYGPVQNRAQYDRVCGLIDDARSNGARFVAGGRPIDRPGYFIELSVCTGISNGVKLVDEEQFGPVIPVVAYEQVDQAVAMANAGEAGLGASVWGGDETAMSDVAHRLVAGSVWIDDHAGVDAFTPFGGAKQSGLGSSFGRSGLAQFTQPYVVSRPRQHEEVA